MADFETILPGVDPMEFFQRLDLAGKRSFKDESGLVVGIDNLTGELSRFKAFLGIATPEMRARYEELSTMYQPKEIVNDILR